MAISSTHFRAKYPPCHVHIHHTHMHILIRMYVCFFQGSGFWLSNIWETSMPHLPYLQLHIKPIRSRMWRKATLMHWWGTIHFWAIWEYRLRNSDFLLKNLQNLRIDKLIKVWVIMHFLYNHSVSQPPKAGEAICPTYQVKGKNIANLFNSW